LVPPGRKALSSAAIVAGETVTLASLPFSSSHLRLADAASVTTGGLCDRGDGRQPLRSPNHQRWVADALDDGLRLAVIVEKVNMSWLLRRRARSVRTRLVVLYDGH
jgi:hypothetical protein